MEIHSFQIKNSDNLTLSKFNNPVVNSHDSITDTDLKIYGSAMRSIAFTGIKPSKELIEKELLSGKKAKEIREMYGLTKEQFQRFCSKEGIITPKKQALINSSNVTKEQIEELISQGKSRQEICDILGIKKNALQDKINEYGIESESKKQRESAANITKELLEQYDAEGKTIEEIADIFGVSKATIQNRKNKFGMVSQTKQSKLNYRNITEEDITVLMEQGMSMAQIRETLGNIPKTSFNRILNRLGIETSQKKAIQHNNSISREAIQVRLDAGMPVKQIQEELGIGRSEWQKKLREFGIETADTQKYKKADTLTKELLETERSAGLSVSEISKKYNISQKAVYKRMHLYGLELSQPKTKTTVDITKEDILKRLAQGKTHNEIREEFGLSKDKYRYRLAEFQMETDLQKRRKLNKNITREQLGELVNSGKSITEISEILGISDETCVLKMKEFGLSTSRQDYRQKIHNITGDDIKAGLDANKKMSEICEELGISESVYYRKLYGSNITTDRKQSIIAADSITKEQLLSVISSGKTLKQICEELGIKSSDTYYRKLNEFGLNTLNQLENQRISSITKEELLHNIIEGKDASELCRTYNISPLRCKSLLRKHNLHITAKPSNIDYKNTSVQEIKDNIIDIFCENDRLANNEKLAGLTDFLTDKKDYNHKDLSYLIRFSQLFDGVKAGLTTPEEIIETGTFKHLNKLKDTADEHFAETNLQIESIISYFSDKIDSGKIIGLCYKYKPKSSTDSNLKNSNYLIECIREYLKKQNPDNTGYKPLERRLVFHDMEVSHPDDEVFTLAKKYAADNNGNINHEKGGLFIEKYQQYKNQELSEYPEYFINVLKENKLDAKDAVAYLEKFEQWQNLDKREQSLLGSFTRMFDSSNPVDENIIKQYVENFYNSVDTYISAQGKHGTSAANLRQEAAFAKNAKKEICKRFSYPDNVKMMSKFEDAMKYIVPPKGQYGIKQLTGVKNQDWEVKISDTDRLISSDNSFYFDTYLPEGFHKKKTAKN